MIKLIRSTFTAIALGLLFSIPYAAPIDAAAKFDDSLNLMTTANLPACTAGNSGSSAAVSDYAGSIAWGSPVGAGGGTGVAKVYCNGSSWTVFAGGGGGTGGGGGMPAPSIASNTAALGNYANSCNGNGTSCLLFEDQFNGTTTPPNQGGATGLSNLWVPYMANGTCGTTCPWHRWFEDERNSTNTATTSTPSPFAGVRPCSTTFSLTNPPWDLCPVVNQPNVGELVNSYGNAFPYGTNINPGDGNHLLGGVSNGGKMSMITTPGSPNAVLPSDGTFQAVNMFADGHVWTGVDISSNYPNTSILSGKNAMSCPSTGCYVQWQAQLEDCSKGGDMSFVLYMADGFQGSGTNEFDVNECGFEYFGPGNAPPNENYVLSPTMQTGGNFTGYALCWDGNGGTTRQVGTAGSPTKAPECQANLGVDLTQGYHIWGVEYNPFNWFKVYVDGILIGTFFSTAGDVGNRAYSVVLEGDMSYGPSFRSKEDWPTIPSATGNCCTSRPNETYTTNVKDIQVYKLPGQ